MPPPAPIVADHGGRIPNTLEGLSSLPGIGRYTAGAIASIAFARQAPILDGNVARVLARWFAITQPIDGPPVRRRLWRLAEKLVPLEAPGDFNQAMMELGALICTPRAPRCPACPVAQVCRARRSGLVGQIPVRTAKRQPTPVEHHILALSRAGKLLLERRSDTGLWSGMWQLLTVESLTGPVGTAQLGAWARNHTGLKFSAPRQTGAFTHQTTHRTISFVLWHARATGGRLRPGTGVWRNPNRVDDLPLPNPQRRALRLIEEKIKSGSKKLEPRSHEVTKKTRGKYKN